MSYDDTIRDDNFWRRPRLRRMRRIAPDVRVRPWWWRMAWTLNDIYTVATAEARPSDDGVNDHYDVRPRRDAHVKRPSSAERLAAQHQRQGQPWEPF